ncbi:cephalosporin-C deacetylase [Parabacteroides sp. PF5-5]|uniref:acetylxylan esterase n=1 Tax=unclassified Parabacteroides TaxID=2649774 RepID=UPI0024749222|nr:MULTISPECIES: acetylxylan esterase [unclassified Parabacteroides]MDH6306901.1 cephalosporin-C deacetylase [Parabacteroides sp. PH5-39]MDH6317711.1 cephalosporin-C deacetylase [Parabacteroides sp. PF5-13]MDH6321702.1 cephalosporin-C deacetylase [Parabacteroides sp. PH5-13]MDH6325288.1 cephalosporin-C deacetylase [Parabacteroides sp. PH5-8]MDH6328896.1 cephalosporin-C deacetylase [Parabacteroides sp. PH5-41]
MKTVIVALFSAFLFASGLFAQPSQKLIRIIIEPNHADWTYRVGEEAEVSIYVLKNNVRLSNITVKCSYGPEMFPPKKETSLDIKKKEVSMKVPGMKTPGFQTVRVSTEVDGRNYSEYVNLGYEPAKIQPTTTLPADFMDFWNQAKQEAANVPLEPLMTLMPEYCTPDLNVYHVRFQNNAPGSYIYGMLCVPKKEGKYPAVLQLPGAGLHSFSGYKSLASRGVITLEIGIHGIPVNMQQEVYNNLAAGALRGYSHYNLDNKDTYYFKRVLTGCVRAIDFLFTLNDFDKKNLASMGGSQGGALSIITAALDPRVTCFTSRHPGMCDITGYKHGRAGGSPGLKDPKMIGWEQKLETSRYYDVVNFARLIKVPGCLTWGYNDPACPPTTMYSAYNVITAEKTLMLYTETAHWHFNEQMQAVEAWVLNKLNVK